MINKENIKKWVNALRSGEYQQGRQRLKDKYNDFCCLGVACDVYHRETGEGEWNETVNYIGFIDGAGNDSSVLLPPEVREWLGVENATPIVKNNTLTSYNDFIGSSFLEIADMIEEEFLKEDVNV